MSPPRLRATNYDLTSLLSTYPWLRDRYHAFLVRAMAAGIPIAISAAAVIISGEDSARIPDAELTQAVSLLLSTLHQLKFQTAAVNLLLADISGLQYLDGFLPSPESYLVV